jgi:serine/threonine protein kinase
LVHNQITENRIGKYCIQEELGRGGMGVVYRAFEPVLHREVALKLLPPNVSGQEKLVSRLRHEAISTARLRHPNIAMIYDFSQDQDDAYLVMEYVAGESLQQILCEGSVSIERSIHILKQMGAALDYAHSIGVVHRDVKPSNIIIGAEDHAMLVDFGLAEITDNTMMTPDGVVLGTPHYMSPEQAAGRLATDNSDQYALAAVAYELLTGVPPFPYSNTTAVVHAHIYELPPQATENNPLLPPRVNSVLAKALSKSPEDRFPTVMEFVKKLEEAVKPSPRDEPSAWKKWIMPWVVSIGVLLLLVLAYLFFSGAMTRLFRDPALNTFNLPNKFAWNYDPGFVGGPELVPLDNVLIIGSDDGQLTALQANNGSVLWKTNVNDLKFGYPAASGELVFVGDHFERIEGLSLRTGGTVWRTKVTGRVQLAPVVYQNRLIAVTSKGYIYVLNAENGRVIWSRPFVVGVQVIGFAPGHLLIGSDSSLYALDLENGMVKWEFETSSAITTQPAAFDDLVLIGTAQGLIHVIDLADGAEQWRYQASGTVRAAPAVDEQMIYVADQSGKLAAINMLQRKVVWEFQAGSSLETTPLIYNRFLILGSSNGKVLILDKDEGVMFEEISLNTSINTNLTQENGMVFIRADHIYALIP